MYADLCHHFKPHQRVEQPLPVILRGETLSAGFRHYITNFQFPGAGAAPTADIWWQRMAKSLSNHVSQSVNL